MTRFAILAPRNRAVPSDLCPLLATTQCMVAGEITVRGHGEDAFDQLPRDPRCLYIEMERGQVYRADPSGIVYKGDLLALLGYGDIGQAFEGTTYLALTLGSRLRVSLSHVIAEALNANEARVLATLMAGAPIEISRSNLVGILVGALALASDRASTMLARGEDAETEIGCRFADIVGSLDHLPQALCA